MSDTITGQRVEPILDPGAPPAQSYPHPGYGVSGSDPVAAAAPEPSPSQPSSLADQLARLEDKTARIEEKLARSEAVTQRVVDRFEAASQRMNEVAQQSDLTHVRGDAHYVARRVKRMPTTPATILTAIVAAFLTSILTAAIFRFLPAITGQ